MSIPTVTDTTQRMWDLLPELYRAADETDGDFPLERFMSLLGDQAGEIEALFDRIDYKTVDEGLDGGTSDLVDPDTADETWLPWLAQLVGIHVERIPTLAHSWAQIGLDFDDWSAVTTRFATWEQLLQYGSTIAGATIGADLLRAAIGDASIGWLATSRVGYETLLAPYLSGEKRVFFTPIYTGDPWKLLIETYRTETPTPAAVEAIIGVAPHAAGLLIIYATRVGSPWSQIVADFATWTDVLVTFPTWADVAAYEP